MQISFTQATSALPRSPSYRILIVGDFDPARQAADALPIRVDRSGFPTLLENLAPAIVLDLDNRLTGTAETWWPRLEFRSLKDFTPAGLLRHVPELNWIDALRRTINDVAAGKASPDGLRAALGDYSAIPALAGAIDLCRRALDIGAATPAGTARTAPDAQAGAEPAASTQASDGLERLFDLVQTPDQPDTGAAARDAVTSAIASFSRKNADHRASAPLLTDASNRVTDLLQEQIGLILAHPRFQGLEQTWRGLRWLLDGVGGDAPVDVQLLHCASVDIAAEAIATAEPAETQDGTSRFDLVLLDFAFGPADSALLAALAKTAESNSTPILVTLADDFFITPEQRPLAQINDPANLLDQPEYLKWNALRENEAARWIAVCFNNFALRLPYAETDRAAANTAQPQQPFACGIWGHAGWLVARRVAEQQQNSDWPSPITGADAGRIQDLTLVATGDSREIDDQRPLRHALSPDQAEELGKVGIVALGCATNQDNAWILSAPTLLRIKPQAAPAATRQLRRDASLPAQLLRTRLANCILGTLDRLPGSNAEQRGAELERYAQALVGNTGRSAGAEVARDPQRPERLLLSVNLGEHVLPGLNVGLQLDIKD